jgi:NAD(P)-dependent dehydrogenase (short-subunit alcohol dehydrogenase family)
LTPYVAAKHGLEGLSDVLRLELRQLGVTVAVIEPGFIATAMGGKLQHDTESAIRAMPDDGRRRYRRQLEAVAEKISEHAANGSGPDEVADAVLRALTATSHTRAIPSAQARNKCCSWGA